MKHMRHVVTVVLVALALLCAAQEAGAIKKVQPDPRGIELLNKFMNAILIEDEQARLEAVLPLVHKSLLSDTGKDLSDNVKPWSYKKACQNAKFYKVPIDIKEVHEGNTYTVGFGNTAELGRSDKYFIRKKDGVAGMPAPLIVFFPKDGGDPKVINMGSL